MSLEKRIIEIEEKLAERKKISLTTIKDLLNVLYAILLIVMCFLSSIDHQKIANLVNQQNGAYQQLMMLAFAPSDNETLGDD